MKKVALSIPHLSPIILGDNFKIFLRIATRLNFSSEFYRNTYFLPWFEKSMNEKRPEGEGFQQRQQNRTPA